MTTTRTHRRPAKFEECITGDDLDEVVTSDEDSVTVHRQCDGKINNITFKIEAENIDTWKHGIVTFFGESRTTLLNSNRVVKINYDTKNWVKFNFFDTGSVNIQGASCLSFHDTYFSKLDMFIKEIVRKQTEPQNLGLINKRNNSDNESEQSEAMNNSETELKMVPDLETELKTVHELTNNTVISQSSESTPMKKSGNAPKRQMTPKEKINNHSKTIEMKFNEIHNILYVIDNTLKSFAEKLSQLSSIKSQSKIPELSQSLLTDLLNTHKKKLHEHLDDIESKVKHCNSTIDSLHVKTNILDNQLKEIIGSQNQQTSLLETLQSQITNLQDRVEYIETTNSSWLTHIDNPKHLNEHLPVVSPKAGKSPTLPKPHSLQSSICSTNANNPVVNSSPADVMLPNPLDNNLQKTEDNANTVTECDVLILSDSMLKRIQPKRFTPEGKTIIRFIRGGAKVCSNFVEKYYHKFNPKSVLIHVGTRDLHNNNVKSEEFSDLLKLCTTVWTHSKIYLLPIIYRKDINASKVDQANAAIYAACRQYSKVTVADPFQPTEDMYHDDVHLNFRKGLPAIVKHLKFALNIARDNGNGRRQSTLGSAGATTRHSGSRPVSNTKYENPPLFHFHGHPGSAPWFFPPADPWRAPWAIPQFQR